MNVNDLLIFSGQQRFWNSGTPADQAIVRQAALNAANEEIAIARKWSD